MCKLDVVGNCVPYHLFFWIICKKENLNLISIYKIYNLNLKKFSPPTIYNFSVVFNYTVEVNLKVHRIHDHNSALVRLASENAKLGPIRRAQRVVGGKGG